jgi:murein L,D-transpeptidase YcbB/YkuD
MKHIIFVLIVSTFSLFANVSDYQALDEADRQEFNKSFKVELKKQLKQASKTVNKLYKSIHYEPIWVDKDYLTYHCEMLVTELESDFKKGLYPELVEAYQKLMPENHKIFNSDSIEDKVKVEIAVMGLYAKSIDTILKDKKSKYNALTLLQKAVKEKSVMAAIDEIANERTIDKLFTQDMNITVLETKQEKYRALATRLMGKDAKDRLKAMYELLEYQPIWITKKGLTEYTKSLFIHIKSDVTLDKNSSVYQRYQTLNNADLPTENKQISDREFAIAKLYQDFMSHMLYGDIDWKKFLHTLHKTKKHGVWTVHPILETPESLLIESLKYKSLDVAFKKAKPAFPLYDRYLTALETYRTIVENGGWKELEDFKNLKPGMSASIVPALRERLALEGDYACDENETGEEYTGCLVEAVKKFQGRHGLETEGYVGKMTRKALSETAEEKVTKLKLNIDRIKWIKRGDDRYHIFINIPSFTMYMFDELEVIRSMRVITGRKGHETPVFYGRVRTIVLNPYWRIPASIIRHETIPKLKKDPGY